jgi:hypothetical protein
MWGLYSVYNSHQAVHLSIGSIEDLYGGSRIAPKVSSGYDALSTNLVMQLYDDIETKIFQDRARETLRYDALLQVMIGSSVWIYISFSAAFATFDGCRAIPMPRRVWHMLLWKRFAIKRW